MRGGRNKFGPMYKRDRAKKLQRLRHHNGPGSSSGGGGGGSSSMVYGGGGGGGQQANPPSYMSPIHIKQEDDKTIQIPQVTSMTSSPDSSPSPQLNVFNNTGQNNPGGGGGGGGGSEIVAVLAGGAANGNGSSSSVAAQVAAQLRQQVPVSAPAQGAAAVAAAAAGAGHPAVKQQTAEGCPPEWNSLGRGQQNPMVSWSKRCEHKI